MKIIKKSRSRSRGLGATSNDDDDASQSTAQKRLSTRGDQSPLRKAGAAAVGKAVAREASRGRQERPARPDTARLARLNQWVRKTYGEASIYIGQLGETSERSGLGVMKYKNGRQYEGSWRGDLRVGEGFERYQNGNSYSGRFLKGKAHGHGVYTWNNGEVYDGEWDRGLKQGHGLWKGVNKDSYVGEWLKS